MGKLVVSLEGVVIKDVQLTKDKTTLGRRPYNDIVIDNLAVSGEHAVLQMVGSDVFIEDLNSTNGTYINGKAVKKQLLTHNDTVEIGKYKIKYLVGEGNEYEKTQVFKSEAPAGAAPRDFAVPSGLGMLGNTASPASIRVLNGAAPDARWCLPRSSPPSASQACRWPRSQNGPTATCLRTSTA
jgi:pSer/pThr/pTyr-binding forkhead associated (FHA) protein